MDIETEKEIRSKLEQRAQWYGKINGDGVSIVATGANGRYADPVHYKIKIETVPGVPGCGQTIHKTATGADDAVLMVRSLTLPSVV